MRPEMHPEVREVLDRSGGQLRPAHPEGTRPALRELELRGKFLAIGLDRRPILVALPGGGPDRWIPLFSEEAGLHALMEAIEMDVYSVKRVGSASALVTYARVVGLRIAVNPRTIGENTEYEEILLTEGVTP